MILTKSADDINKLCTGFVRNYQKKYKQQLSIPLVIKRIIIEYYINQIIKLINNHPNRFDKNCFKAYTFNADQIYY